MSSVISGILGVFWWLMLGAMVLGVPLETLVLFHFPEPGTALYAILTYLDIPSSVERTGLYKLLMLLQTAGIVPVILLLIHKLHKLFIHLSANQVFIAENIKILKQLALLFMLLSILSVNLLSLLISIVLLVLTEIFLRGVQLQEEIDWIV